MEYRPLRVPRQAIRQDIDTERVHLMFTGIIHSVAVVKDSRPSQGGRRLSLDVSTWSSLPAHGASIAVDGCCLTVAEPPDELQRILALDIVPQTLRMTTLGSLQPGDRVNIESSLKAGTPLDGHCVQGHIDGVARVDSNESLNGDVRLRIQPPESLMEYVVPQGSIAVHGVSLTIADVDDASFEVALIPTTLELTTLGELTVGDSVNIETDQMVRTIIHWLRRYHNDPVRSAHSLM